MSGSQKVRFLKEGEYRFVNAARLEQTSEGVIPLRIDAELLEDSSSFSPNRPDFPAQVLRMSAGIELQIEGNGITHVRIVLRIVQDDGFPQRVSLFQGDFKIHPVRELPGGPSPQTLVWTLPSEAFIPDAPLRIFLPTHAEIEVLNVAVNEGAVIFTKAPFRAACLRWLAHGDSITQGANVSSPDLVWIEQVSRKINLNPVNLGFGGIAYAQEAVAKYIARRQDWDILTIHIGANSFGNRLEDYRHRYAKFLLIILETNPEKTVVCCTPILHHSDWNSSPRSPFAAEPIRQAIRDAVQMIKVPRLHLVEGREIMDEPTGLVGDGLHISDHGAIIYAENLSKRLGQIISSMRQASPRERRQAELSAHSRLAHA